MVWWFPFHGHWGSKKNKNDSKTDDLSFLGEQDSDFEQGILKQTLDLLWDVVVQDTMLPAEHLTAIDADDLEAGNLHLEDCGTQFYFPIYRGQVDAIVGYLSKPELESGKKRWRKVHFVSPTQPVMTLMSEKDESFVVVDEYGGLVGMVGRQEILWAFYDLYRQLALSDTSVPYRIIPTRGRGVFATGNTPVAALKVALNSMGEMEGEKADLTIGQCVRVRGRIFPGEVLFVEEWKWIIQILRVRGNIPIWVRIDVES